MMLIDDSRVGAFDVVAINGELDAAAAPQVRARIIEVLDRLAITEATPLHLALDLRGVDFIDSFGLGVIIGALKRTSVMQRELRLIVGPGPVRQILGLTDLDQVLVCVEDLSSLSRLPGDQNCGPVSR